MDKELHTNFVIRISDGDVPQDGPERTESICRLLCDIDEEGSDPEPCVFVVSLWNWWMLAESERRAGIDVPFDAFAGSLPPLLVSPVLSPDGEKYTHEREYWAQQQQAKALACRAFPCSISSTKTAGVEVPGTGSAWPSLFLSLNTICEALGLFSSNVTIGSGPSPPES